MSVASSLLYWVTSPSTGLLATQTGPSLAGASIAHSAVHQFPSFPFPQIAVAMSPFGGFSAIWTPFLFYAVTKAWCPGSLMLPPHTLICPAWRLVWGAACSPAGARWPEIPSLRSPNWRRTWSWFSVCLKEFPGCRSSLQSEQQ